MKIKHTLVIAAAIFAVATIVIAGVTNLDSLTLSNDIIVGDDLTVTDDATVNGDLSVTGSFDADSGLSIPDDTSLVFGDDSDFSMKYDEAGTDKLLASGAEISFAQALTMAENKFLTIGNYTAEHDNDGTGDFVFTAPNASSGFGFYTGNLAVGNGTPDVAQDGEDAYVEGTIEVDGAARFDGAITANSTITMDVDSLLTIGDYTGEHDDNGTGFFLWDCPAASSGYAIYTGNMKIGNGTPSVAQDGEDLYVEGQLEIDGGFYVGSGIAVPDDVSIAFGSDNDVLMKFDEAGTDQLRVSGKSIISEEVIEIDTETDTASAALILDQDDSDQPFFQVDGTEAADNSANISTANGDGSVEGPKNFSSTAGWNFAKMFKVQINSTEYWLPAFSYDPD